MVDVGSHHFVKSSAKSDRVLVPQPSDDPHDPLVRLTAWPFLPITSLLIDSGIELEHILEVFRAHRGQFGYFHSGHRPVVLGSYVSAAD